MDLFREGFVTLLRRQTATAHRVHARYVGWLFPRARFRIRHDCDVKQVRGRIDFGLRLDPAVIAIAKRSIQGRRPDGVLSLRDHNQAVQHRALHHKGGGVR